MVFATEGCVQPGLQRYLPSPQGTSSSQAPAKSRGSDEKRDLNQVDAAEKDHNISQLICAVWCRLPNCFPPKSFVDADDQGLERRSLIGSQAHRRHSRHDLAKTQVMD